MSDTNKINDDSASTDTDDSLYDSDSDVNAEASSKVIFPTIGEHDIVNPQPITFKRNYPPILEEVSLEERRLVETEMKNTIVSHRGNFGGIFTDYNITKVERVVSGYAWRKYKRQKDIFKAQGTDSSEHLYWHGTANVDNIIKTGLDERFAKSNNLMYGKGIYFAKHSSKANQYVYGFMGKYGCPNHNDKTCKICDRRLLLCRVLMGKVKQLKRNYKYDHAPEGFDSIEAVPRDSDARRIRGTVKYSEYIIYNDAQTYPHYVVTYKIV